MSQKCEENSLCNDAPSEASDNIQPSMDNPIDLREKEISSDDITDGRTTNTYKDKNSSYKEESECRNVKESFSDEELGEETNNLEQMDSMEPLATTRTDTTGKFIFARIVFNISPHCII